MADRGVLAPGYLADVNVVDFEALRLRAPEIISDLPADGRRLVQRAEGYRVTVKSERLRSAMARQWSRINRACVDDSFAALSQPRADSSAPTV